MMKNWKSILFAILIFTALSVYEAQAQEAKGRIITPSGLTIDASTVMLRFKLGVVDHKAASTAIAMLQCMEQALEVPGTDFTWQQCRDRGYKELKTLLLEHNSLDKQIRGKVGQKKV